MLLTGTCRGEELCRLRVLNPLFRLDTRALPIRGPAAWGHAMRRGLEPVWVGECLRARLTGAHICANI
jgi:hypothetical protein